MTEDWLDRWSSGRIGWHEPGGNTGLQSHWPEIPQGSRVLVPLCGKSPDLLWLARKGYDVVGIELSGIAVRAFFAEHSLAFTEERGERLNKFTGRDVPVTLFEGDYFEFTADPFDALYDRGALVAMPGDMRPRYVEHTKSLLKTDAARFVVTLEYDQSVVSGPPFSVPATELAGYWDDLIVVEQRDDFATCPPKFRAAGLSDISEKFWCSA